MTVFRWIIGVISALLVSGSVISFIFFMAGDDERWIDIARRFRHLATVALLFWFNAEVWGRVVYTIVTW
jgi:transposase